MDFSNYIPPEKILTTPHSSTELGPSAEVGNLDKLSKFDIPATPADITTLDAPLKLDIPVPPMDTSTLDMPLKINMLVQPMDTSTLDTPLKIFQSPELHGTSAIESRSIAGTDVRLSEASDSLSCVPSRYLPETGGEWSGDKGDSNWIPDDDTVPKKHNIAEKTWAEIKDEYGFETIPFEEGEPDFTEVSEATVEIEDFSVDRNANFTQADEACAKQWSEQNKDDKTWTAADVKEYRKENQLSWHERSDQKTIDLVSSVVHGNVPHSGGISAAKKEAA